MSAGVPVPVGTVVRYTGSLDHGTYVVIKHAEPINTSNASDEVFKAAFPDGVAYELWPVEVERRFGNRSRLIHNVRRTSFTVSGDA